MDNVFDKMFYSEGEFLGGLAASSIHDIAGPLVSACVILPKIDIHKDDLEIFSVGEPSKITWELLEKLSATILSRALGVGIGYCWPMEMDYLGARRAKELAMARAVAHLKNPVDQKPMGVDHLLIADEKMLKVPVDIPQTVVPQGIRKSLVLASAALIVRLRHDEFMRKEMDKAYPGRGFDRHLGKATEQHFQFLDDYGFVPGIHRIRRWPFVKKDKSKENYIWVRRRQKWKERSMDQMAVKELGQLWTDEPISKMLSLEPSPS